MAAFYWSISPGGQRHSSTREEQIIYRDGVSNFHTLLFFTNIFILETNIIWQHLQWQ